MSAKGSVEADVKRQASVRNQPKPAEPKEPKYHAWNRPKVTRDPNVARRLQQGYYVPPPTFYSPEPARDHFDSPPPYYPPEPARPTHGHSDKCRSHHDDNGLRRTQTTHRQQRSEGIPNHSQRESEGLNRGHGDEGRSRHNDHSKRGSDHNSQRGDQHGGQRSS